MTPHDAKATCYFLDVGQGSSQVVLLGQGRAIVIDGGPGCRVPLRLLDRYVTRIVSLVVSHNDADHHRGALGVLRAYHSRLDEVCFLEDREFTEIGLYDEAAKLSRTHRVRVRRLERVDGLTVLYEDPATGVTLDILYPSYLDNLDARATGDPNATCGVLILSCGTRRVVFSGDAPVWAWRRIREYLGAAVECDVTTVPHHGGIVWDAGKGPADDLDWLHTEAIRADHAVVSVGTNNGYEHPRGEVFTSLHKNRPAPPSVFCTQVTERCCDPAHLDRLAKGASARPGLAHRTPNGVPCAGTVVVHINTDEVLIERQNDHRSWVDGLARDGARPLCRTAPAAAGP